MILFTKGTELTIFCQLKNSNDVLNKFKSKNFQACLCLFGFVGFLFLLGSGKGCGLWLWHSLNFSLTFFSKLSTYDFSTLYTTLPHHLIKDKPIDLINRTFIRENTQYLACNEECAFFTSDVYNNHNLWSCQKVCDALVYLLDNIFIRVETKLYRQTIGIPMGTNCAPLVADLFLFCYERDFMKSLSRENQADIIEAFNSTSRYLDDLLNIDNIYFDQMVDRIYPTELQLNRANSSDTEAPFFGLNLCISNGTVSTKIYDKRDDFEFDIVNFPFLDDFMGYTYLNLLDSPELLQILMTLTTVIKPLLPNFLGRAIVILNFVRRFRNFVADTVPC